ncbi:uncharacterized protein PHACADRAFT_251691 [Phanerochaete carnosa HHB-10118-sp]|uniref:Uncharacterized protein n=1 Tax=Phanerochaete carnosa (strain HHB-10118-sp) TaxID=650164 RepID=K5WFJ6_PHACS|nr:uncharacterized protein PHACADRAFT_251691 [Phanerochaete carnosa HHB-10118-sp]EKM57824.1 hypothetical protein PHACADRAFT_251691 [Phanerochaete carnosa HHB-10118-sp]
MQMPSNTPLQQNPQANHTPGVLGTHGLPMQQQPPRSGPTPLSHMNMPQNGMQSSPGMPAPMASPPNANQPPQPPISNGMPQFAQQQQFQQAQRPGQGQIPSQTQIPALPAEAFKAAYGQWCHKQNIAHDEQLLQIEGKRIDLHRLHQEVIAAGTMHRVRI